MIKSLYPFLSLLLLCISLNAVAQTETIAAIKNSNAYAVLRDGSVATDITIDRKWNGNYCTTSISNKGQHNRNIKEVVLMHADRLFDAKTNFYAEGFQMLSQYRGTLGSPKLIGSYDDNGHYKLPQPAGYKAVYNMLILDGSQGQELL